MRLQIVIKAACAVRCMATKGPHPGTVPVHELGFTGSTPDALDVSGRALARGPKSGTVRLMCGFQPQRSRAMLRVTIEAVIH